MASVAFEEMFSVPIIVTHQMSEVGYHTSILAFSHVQGLGFGTQNVKTSVTTNMVK